MRAPPRPASSNRVDAEVARIGKENEAMNTSTTPDVLAPRRSTPENLSAIKESLGEVAVNEKERLQGAVARTKDRFVRAEDKFENFVRERPVQSILIAAGAGLAIGWLLGRRR